MTPSTDVGSPPSRGKSSQFWRVFWLTFLVVSLGYAWYSFYAPSNRIAWADNFTDAQQQAAKSDKPLLLFFTGKWCSPFGNVLHWKQGGMGKAEFLELIAEQP